MSEETSEQKHAREDREAAIKSIASGDGKVKNFSVKAFFGFWIFLLITLFSIIPLIIGMLASGYVSFGGWFLFLGIFIPLQVIGFCLGIEKNEEREKERNFIRGLFYFVGLMGVILNGIMKELNGSKKNFKAYKTGKKIISSLKLIVYILAILISITFFSSLGLNLNSLIMSCVFWTAIFVVILTIAFGFNALANPEIISLEDGKVLLSKDNSKVEEVTK